MAGQTSPGTRAGYLTKLQLALEQVRRGAGNICQTLEWRLWDGKWHLHHLYPQQFRDCFMRTMRLDVDAKQFLVDVPDWFHKRLHPWWNSRWAEWIARREASGNPTQFRDAVEFLNQLLKELEQAGCGKLKIVDLLHSVRPTAQQLAEQRARELGGR